MKEHFVIKPRTHEPEKIRHRLRGTVGPQLDDDLAQTGFQHDDGPGVLIDAALVGAARTGRA